MATVSSGGPCRLGRGCTLGMWQWSQPNRSELSHYRPTLTHHIFFARHIDDHIFFAHHIDDHISGLFVADDSVGRRRIHDTAAWNVDVHQ